MTVLFSHRKPNLFLIGYLSVGAVLYLYATHCGLGLTYDSHHYLAAAQSLLHQGALHNADGTVYTNWPPLYPVFLAMFGANLEWIRIGQLLIFLGILFFCYQMSQQAIQQRVIRFGFLTTILFGTPLLLVNVFVWSEGLFVLLTLVLYAFLRRYQQTNQPLWFWGLIVLSNLLCLQRLVGLLFVIAIGVLLWLEQKDPKKVFLYYFLSCLGIGLWILRNTQFESKPSFLDNVWQTPFVLTVTEYIHALSAWFIQLAFPFVVQSGVVVLLLSGILFWLLTSAGSDKVQIAILGIGYLLGMIALEGALTETDRFAAPAYIWIMLTVSMCVEAISDRLFQKRRWLFVGILGLWLLYPITRTIKNAIFWQTVNCQKKANG